MLSPRGSRVVWLWSLSLSPEPTDKECEALQFFPTPSLSHHECWKYKKHPLCMRGEVSASISLLYETPIRKNSGFCTLSSQLKPEK